MHTALRRKALSLRQNSNQALLLAASNKAHDGPRTVLALHRCQNEHCGTEFVFNRVHSGSASCPVCSSTALPVRQAKQTQASALVLSQAEIAKDLVVVSKCKDCGTTYRTTSDQAVLLDGGHMNCPVCKAEDMYMGAPEEALDEEDDAVEDGEALEEPSNELEDEEYEEEVEAKTTSDSDMELEDNLYGEDDSVVPNQKSLLDAIPDLEEGLEDAEDDENEETAEDKKEVEGVLPKIKPLPAEPVELNAPTTPPVSEPKTIATNLLNLAANDPSPFHLIEVAGVRYMFKSGRIVAWFNSAKLSPRLSALSAAKFGQVLCEAIEKTGGTAITPDIMQDFAVEPVIVEQTIDAAITQKVDEAVQGKQELLDQQQQMQTENFQQALDMAAAAYCKGLVGEDKSLVKHIAEDFRKAGVRNAEVAALKLVSSVLPKGLQAILAKAQEFTKMSPATLNAVSAVIASAKDLSPTASENLAEVMANGSVPFMLTSTQAQVTSGVSVKTAREQTAAIFTDYFNR